MRHRGGPHPAGSDLPRPRRPARDRHERGIRGSLVPPEHPLSTTRAQRFDDLVLDAVDDIEVRVRARLEHVQFAVEDVPALEGSEDDSVPLARTFPTHGGQHARIVVYRRPVETRATGLAELRALVRDVVVEEVAGLLGLTPQEVDPTYGEDGTPGGRRRRGSGPTDRP